MLSKLCFPCLGAHNYLKVNSQIVLTTQASTIVQKPSKEKTTSFANSTKIVIYLLCQSVNVR